MLWDFYLFSGGSAKPNQKIDEVQLKVYVTSTIPSAIMLKKLTMLLLTMIIYNQLYLLLSTSRLPLINRWRNINSPINWELILFYHIYVSKIRVLPTVIILAKYDSFSKITVVTTWKHFAMRRVAQNCLWLGRENLDTPVESHLIHISRLENGCPPALPQRFLYHTKCQPYLVQWFDIFFEISQSSIVIYLQFKINYCWSGC